MKEFKPSYLVSEEGRIFRVRKTKTVELMGSISHTGRGYKILSVWDAELKKGKSIPFHRIVAKAFIPNPENKPEVNHIDGNTMNNKVTNLEWVTRSENIQHAWDTGLCVFTENQRKAIAKTRKLSKDEANSIRKRYIPRDKVNGIRALGREFNVSKVVIQRIVHDDAYYKEV